MKKNIFYTILLVGCFSLTTWSQGNVTPTPTPKPFQADCGFATSTVNLIPNGDFEAAQAGWIFSGAQLLTQTFLDVDNVAQTNHYAWIRPGEAILTHPLSDPNNTTFQLRFCALIYNGQIKVRFSNPFNEFQFPNLPTAEQEGQFRRGSLRLDLQSAANADQILIEFFFEPIAGQDGFAYIDNIELVPDITDPDEPTGTPTVIPTMTSTPTPTGPPATPTPTLVPGAITPTATPGLTAESVQIMANPPMLLVSPDDFVGNRIRKQSVLNFQVIGSNGEPLDIAAIDPDATIQFTIQNRGDQENAGTVALQISPTNSDNLVTERKKIADIGDTIMFVPTKPFDGTVRVAAEIKFQGHAGGRRQDQVIRGIVPVVVRSDPRSSLTDPTGTYNAQTSANRNRKPGDRGFRPDDRTNLFFRELYE